MKCKICKSVSNEIFKGKILNKYLINYYYCETCGFLQTEEPYWIEESYKESINLSDTGILSRNLILSNITTSIIYLYFNKSGKYLDYAGGYGIFVRLMRDIGVDFYWQDKFSQNLLAKGFAYDENEKYEMITSFEAFEHFQNPVEEIENMLTYSSSILFSTDLLPVSPPIPDEWWYYGLDHGQHISFYNVKTLKYIADKYDLILYTNGQNIHLFTKNKISRFLFKNIIKLSNRGLSNFLKKRFKSKTLDDHKLRKMH